MTAQDYDAVVIGSGMAGLTAATRLAAGGLKVALLEKNGWVGGYAHGFGQDGFYWDHGGHIFLAYQRDGQARRIFKELRLDEQVEMRPVKQNWRCDFPGDSLTIPSDLLGAAEVIGERFPAEREGIRRIFRTMGKIITEADMIVPAFQVRPGGRGRVIDPVIEQFQRDGVSKAVSRIPGLDKFPGGTLLKYQPRTFAQLIDEHVRDPRLKAYMSMISAGISAGPEELSAVIAAVFYVHALRTMYLPIGGFGALAQKTAQLFEKHGGVIHTDSEVERILLDNGRAVGAETADGRRFRARAVISACDGRRTLLKMIDPQRLPGALRDGLPDYKLTRSIFQVHLGVDMDLTPYRSELERLTFVYPHDDVQRAMALFESGDYERAAYFLYIATLHQNEMAPPGMHSIKIEAYTRLDAPGIDWERDKERIADSLVARAGKIIPGLGEHTVTRALRTPLDLARDTGNSEGSYAGWAFDTAMLSRNRPQPRTAVPGLYLAGHWTTPSAGVPWVMLSGFNTASRVARDLS
jgi:phytoene dehydrogenase-like protein